MMNPQFIDSHCHLNDERLGDIDLVVHRAEAAGVVKMVTIGTSLNETARLQEIAHTYDNIYYTVGVHPNDVSELETPTTLASSLSVVVHDKKMIGFGETGLDYYYEHSPRDIQQECFRHHLRAGLENSLPVIIHCRGAEAEKDIIQIIEDESYDPVYVPGIIHCFTGSPEFATAALDKGFYISISGVVTFKNAHELQEIVKGLPLDKILIETDAPYLAPAPMRGKTNEPSFVVHTASFIAALKGISVDEIAQATTENFYKVFPKCLVQG